MSLPHKNSGQQERRAYNLRFASPRLHRQTRRALVYSSLGIYAVALVKAAVMIIRSPGYRTDLFFPRFDRPPIAGDLGRWRALFAKEIRGCDADP